MLYVPATLQGAYNNSANGTLIVDGTRLGIVIQDAATPITAPVFKVTSTGSTQTAMNATITGLGTVQTGIGLTLQNTTAATSGTKQQYSPALEWLAHGWNGADATSKVLVQNQADSADAHNVLAWYSSKAGAAYSNYFNIEFDSIISGSLVFRQPSTTYMAFFDSNNNGFKIQAGTTYVRAGGVDIWQTTSLGVSPVSDNSYVNGTGGNRWSVVGTYRLDALAQTGNNCVIVKGNASNYKALATFQDSNGNGHWGIDCAGFPTLGTMFDWTENWMWSSGVNQTSGATVNNSSNVWAFSSVNGAPIVQTAGLSGSPVASLLYITGSTSNNATEVSTMLAVVDTSQLTKLYVIYNAACALDTVGANNATIAIGLANTSLGAVHPNGLYFSKTSAQTNWQCNCDDGTTTTTVDSGVAPTANTLQEFRIEFYGSASMSGALTVKFYIDGNAAATITTHVGTAALKCRYYNITTSGSTTTKLYMGQVRVTFNRIASPFVN